jgi:hypothetical protein
MSLIVDFTKIDEDMKKIYSPHQEVIGYHMMAIGMGEITEKNYCEVYARLVLLHASTLQYDEPWMNLKMVKHLIGAEFNIAFESKAKFSSRMLRATFYDVKRLEEKGVQDVA